MREPELKDSWYYFNWKIKQKARTYEGENKWVPIVTKSRSIKLSRKGITGRYSLLNRVSKNKATIEFSKQLQFNDWLFIFYFFIFNLFSMCQLAIHKVKEMHIATSSILNWRASYKLFWQSTLWKRHTSPASIQFVTILSKIQKESSVNSFVL